MTTLLRFVRSVALVTAAAAALVGDASIQASSDLSRLDRALRETVQRHESGPVRIIVRARRRETAIVERTLRARGGRVLSEQPALDSVTATVSTNELAHLASDQHIAGISLDARVKTLAKNGAASSTQTIQEILLATLGLDGTESGEGVGVGVVDSGFEPAALQDFDQSRIKFYDFTS